MTTKIHVQDATAASEVSDPFGLRNDKCSARSVHKWQINAAIFHRIKLSDVLKRVIVLALLAGWVAITWGRVSLFLSEPTATKIFWEQDFPPPSFSICPALSVNSAVLVPPTKMRLHNQSLQQFINSSGLSVDNMFYKSDLSYEGNGVYLEKYGTWRTILNYADGGTCATFIPNAKMRTFTGWSSQIRNNSGRC